MARSISQAANGLAPGRATAFARGGINHTGRASSFAAWPMVARQSPNRYVHARAISFRFSAVPKAALRALRIPAYAGAAGAGALTYANYKVEGELWAL